MRERGKERDRKRGRNLKHILEPFQQIQYPIDTNALAASKVRHFMTI